MWNQLSCLIYSRCFPSPIFCSTNMIISILICRFMKFSSCSTSVFCYIFYDVFPANRLIDFNIYIVVLLIILLFSICNYDCRIDRTLFTLSCLAEMVSLKLFRGCYWFNFTFTVTVGLPFNSSLDFSLSKNLLLY